MVTGQLSGAISNQLRQKHLEQHKRLAGYEQLGVGVEGEKAAACGEGAWGAGGAAGCEWCGRGPGLTQRVRTGLNKLNCC